MKKSPWAKLMMCRTPNSKAKPAATSANDEPTTSPLSSCKKIWFTIAGSTCRTGPLHGRPLRGGLLREGPLREGPLREGLLREGLLHEGPLRGGPLRGGLLRGG